MNKNKKYLALSLAIALVILGSGIDTFSFAQTVTPVSCSVNVASVGVNQAAIITASGGNGTYYWSGPNLNIKNSAGGQFAVSYPQTGTYPVTVQSAGQSATCNVNVVAGASTGALSCFPATQNVTVGQTATVSASGGNGTYVWSSPDLTIANPNGSGFSANYASAGLKTLTLTSAGLVTTCAINVLASTSGSGTVVPVTPGLPNTGEDYGQ